MTNYERIKNMSLDEMAKCISDVDNCILCELNSPECFEIDDFDCSAGVKKWLESEAE